MENLNLFGIYGRHSPEACPINNKETAKSIIQWREGGNLPGALEKFKIKRVLGQYHSALEHTFIWIVDGGDAHSIQQFCLATPMAVFNDLKIVPLITFDTASEIFKTIHDL